MNARGEHPHILNPPRDASSHLSCSHRVDATPTNNIHGQFGVVVSCTGDITCILRTTTSSKRHHARQLAR